MIKNPSIILASSSPRRVELLKSINVIPDLIIASDIDESPIKSEHPEKMSLRLAREKALFISSKQSHIHDKQIILAADTVVCASRKNLPKAETDQDIRKYMSLLSGRRHNVFTSICIISMKDGAIEKIREKTVKTIIKFKRLENIEIEEFVRSKEGIGKSGGYAIQGLASGFITFMSGSWSNVVGLPLFETRNLLKSLGYNFR